MLPYLDDFKKLFDIPVIDINAKNIDYNNVILYELDEIPKHKNISVQKNMYNVNINLYFVTSEKDAESHESNFFQLIAILERYNANAIQKMTYAQLIIINNNKFLVSKFDLSFITTIPP